MTPLEQFLLTLALPPIACTIDAAWTTLARRRTRRLNVAAVRAARSVRS